MRILLVAHQFLPRYTAGTEILTRDTGLELLRRGHEVHVLTADPHPEVAPPTLETRDYEHRGLRVHCLVSPEPPDSPQELEWEYRNPHTAPHVASYVERLQPDAIHAFHLLHLSASVVEPLRRADVPFVFTATDFWPFCVRGNLMKRSGELCRGPGPDSVGCLECRQADEWFPQRLPSPLGRDRYFRRVRAQALAQRPDEPKKLGMARIVVERTAAMRSMIGRADAILAPTELTRDLLVENGFDPDRIRVSRYGMDLATFAATRRPRALRTDGPVRLGFIGTLAEHKGAHVLVEAFEHLPGRHADRFTLRLSGSLGQYPKYSRRLLEQAAGDPRINFTGSFPNDRMAAELDQIDVLVVPSTWYENAPLVVYSAFAAGVPVIATEIGGLSEVVTEGVDGLHFRRGDARDLARVLVRLVEERGLIEELSGGTRPGRDVGDSVDEFLALYEELSSRATVRG